MHWLNSEVKPPSDAAWSSINKTLNRYAIDSLRQAFRYLRRNISFIYFLTQQNIQEAVKQSLKLII